MSRKQGLILVLSLALHVAVLAMLRGREEKRKEPQPAIKVRIVGPRKVETRVAPVAAPTPDTAPDTTPDTVVAVPKRRPAPPRLRRPGRATAAAPAADRGTTAPAATRDRGGSSYGSLLPGPNDVLSAESYGDSGSSGAPSRATPSQLAGARDVAATFDVPLAFRTSRPGTRAVAVLRTTDANIHGWLFETLDGDAMLRAALFESLITPATRGKIPALMRSLGFDELMVVLRVDLEQGFARDAVDASRISLEGRKLVIAYSVYRTSEGIRAVPPGAQPEVTGVPIEDEHTRRAKLRDQVHGKRLQQSPAYQAPLRRRAPE